MPRYSGLLLYVATAVLSLAQPAEIPSVTIPRVSRAPKLSDFLSGTPREAELTVTDFRQMDPGDGDPVSQSTTAFLSYDGTNLYAAFIAKDDPRQIRARVARRKQIVSDDRVTINIDTFHDHLHAYWFDVNPYGIQLDGITTDGVGDDFSWEGLWYSEAKIVEDGYVVLITVPFKTLRFPAASKQTWGVMLGRMIQRNNEFSMWPYITRRKLPQFVAQFAHMEGLEDVSPGKNLQIIPYGLLSASRYLDQPAGEVPRFAAEPGYRGGLDGKMVIRDALTLDVALNPDFSQVESDEPQVTVNQRYEVFFPERRPFFMENASYFSVPQSLFFSRRIVDPEFGGRLTGKIGRWGLGVLAADDRAPGRAAAPGDPAYGQRARNGVVSVQRDLLRDSFLRFFGVARELAGGFNRVASLDTRWHLPRDFFFTGQAAATRTRPAGGSVYGGSGYYARLAHSDRRIQYYSQYTDRSPGFHDDLGYIPRTDIREFKNRLGYLSWLTGKALHNFGPAVIVSRNWNHAGTVQDWAAAVEWNMEFTRLSGLTVSRETSFELYNGYAFRKNATYYIFNTEWFKWLAVSANYTRGSGINYYPAAGMAPFLGDSRSARLAVTLRPTARLRLDETYVHDGLRLPGGGASVYQNHIVRSKANYQVTRELSFRAILDYNGVLPNASMVSLDRTKRIGCDLLMTYLLHPGTALYVGYTDIYENLRLDPAKPPYLNLTGFPDLNTGRQVFVKLSYLFRY